MVPKFMNLSGSPYDIHTGTGTLAKEEKTLTLQKTQAMMQLRQTL